MRIIFGFEKYEYEYYLVWKYLPNRIRISLFTFNYLNIIWIPNYLLTSDEIPQVFTVQEMAAHDNLCGLKIKSDTGQHLQFWKCLVVQYCPVSFWFKKYRKNYRFPNNDSFVISFSIYLNIQWNQSQNISFYLLVGSSRSSLRYQEGR